MFNLKRLAKYTLASGLALGLVFSTGVRAMAAEDAVKGAITTNSYEMDYNHNVLRITVMKEDNVPAADKKTDLFANGEPKYVYVGVGKTETAIKAYDRFEVKCEVTDDATTDTPTATKYFYDYYVEVDLPNYVSPAVEYIVKAYSSNQAAADAKTYKIAKQTKKLEVKYAPKDAALTVKADGTDLKATDGTYEIKTLYGDWIDSTKVDAEKYESYAVYGATLVVREKASASKPASKEVKVKIPKKANGPKATINPTKLTVTIPKNTVWRIVGDTPRTDVKANADDKYIWTATATDNEGWIKNSEGKAQALTELQKKITEAGATIEKLKLNPKYDAAETDNTKDAFGKYLKTDGKGTNDPTEADKENTAIALFDEGAVLELKTEATDKKAESKVSFFEIPVQSEAVELGTDFTVSYSLTKDKSKVSKLEVKNPSSSVTLEVALADSSSYDLTKVTFAKLAPGATKAYGASAAKEGKVLLVRTASVAANAKNKVEMALGGKVAECVVAYPKKAEALSGVTLEKKAGATKAGDATLKIASPDEAKAYAYQIGDKEVTLGLGPVLPEGTTVITPAADKSVTKELSGLVADKYITVYEYDADTKAVSKMVSHKITSGEISEAPTPTPEPAA